MEIFAAILLWVFVDLLVGIIKALIWIITAPFYLIGALIKKPTDRK